MQPEIVIYGVDHCEDTQRTRKHLDERGIEYTYVNLDKDESANAKVLEWNHGRRLTPTVVVSGNGRTQRVAEPENDELDAIIGRLGMDSAA
ncbi:MAG: glutaredoxin family protein [Terriglobales bacterium]